MERDPILASVARHARQADALLIEGNRGLYDGLDVQGTYSTAELAKILATPVVLVVDCIMATRTVAALILGCQHFDPQVPLAGVILNQVARPRHEAILRETIEHYCRLPVLGALPRLKCAIFPERHMGLVPPQEHSSGPRAVETAREIAERYLDLEGLWQVASQAPPLPRPKDGFPTKNPPAPKVNIGVIRDSAFQFYYAENLEALVREGARIIEVNALEDQILPPDLDGLYIGGGFPETHAHALSRNRSFRESVRQAVAHGLPIYAECGGLMYLGAAIRIVEGERFPMAGVFPFDFVMGRRPRGHGYTILEVIRENPYFPPGTRLKGHEFHYSRIHPEPGPNDSLAFHVIRGAGIGGHRDGLVYRNVLATFSHLHAMGTPSWAPALVRRALEYQQMRATSQTSKVLPISPLKARKKAG